MNIVVLSDSFYPETSGGGASEVALILAKKLVERSEVWAKNKAHKIWLDTRINNKESIALFKKLKYKKAATFKKHYYGQDFYIWEKLI